MSFVAAHPACVEKLCASDSSQENIPAEVRHHVLDGGMPKVGNQSDCSIREMLYRAAKGSRAHLGGQYKSLNCTLHFTIASVYAFVAYYRLLYLS